MSMFKLKIDTAIKLAELLVAITEDSLDSEEADAMFEDSFKFYKDLLGIYDSKTLLKVQENTEMLLNEIN